MGRLQRHARLVALAADDGDLVPALADPFPVDLAAVVPLEVAGQDGPADGVAEGGRASEPDRLVVAQHQFPAQA